MRSPFNFTHYIKLFNNLKGFIDLSPN